MNREEIKELFMQGLDCSQVVAENFAQELGQDKELMRRLGACFGGGMMRGETCGSVIAALMIIGMKYGHDKEGDGEQKAVMREKSDAFKRCFVEKYGSTMCRELLEYDLSKPDEFQKALESGRLLDFCPRLTEDVILLLKQVLGEQEDDEKRDAKSMKKIEE